MAARRKVLEKYLKDHNYQYLQIQTMYPFMLSYWIEFDNWACGCGRSSIIDNFNIDNDLIDIEINETDCTCTPFDF